MGFKDKMTKYYSDAYMEKYGDRMTSVAGTILSVKTEVNFSILSSKDSTIEEHHICFAKYVNFITW